MEFMLVTTVSVALLVGLLVLLGRAYPGSGADLLDWKPTRSYEDEVQLEQDDIAQMIEAQNEYRRKRGATELTAEDASRMAQEDEDVREKARPGYERRLRESDQPSGGESDQPPGSESDHPRGGGDGPQGGAGRDG